MSFNLKKRAFGVILLTSLVFSCKSIPKADQAPAAVVPKTIEGAAPTVDAAVPSALIAEIKKTLTSREIADLAKPPFVLFAIQTVSGSVTVGSGFFISKNRVATNRHVIESATVLEQVRIIATDSGRVFTMKPHFYKSESDDLALIEINEFSDKFLELGNSAEAKEGDSIYVLGNPYGYTQVFSNGLITSTRVENVYTGENNRRLMMTSAPISPGNSGGPALNEKGNVIGIVMGTDHRGQNLNVIIPSNYLKELIQYADIQQAQPQVTQ